jgi:hypothetical protein
MSHFIEISEFQLNTEALEACSLISSLGAVEPAANEGVAERGFFRSLSRDGRYSCISAWHDERVDFISEGAIVLAGMREVVGVSVMSYRVRVGEVLADSHPLEGSPSVPRTLSGSPSDATIVTAARSEEWGTATNPTVCAQFLGLDCYAGNFLENWDVYESVGNPNTLMLWLEWRDPKALDYFEETEALSLPDTLRRRHAHLKSATGFLKMRAPAQ